MFSDTSLQTFAKSYLGGSYQVKFFVSVIWDVFDFFDNWPQPRLESQTIAVIRI